LIGEFQKTSGIDPEVTGSSLEEIEPGMAAPDGTVEDVLELEQVTSGAFCHQYMQGMY
jgi:hypothetical protein